ncbi:MAG: response regulator, partial [Candidatus Omnitrophota bacterium]
VMAERNTILIVDDLPDNVEILQELLEDDYNLGVAFSGEECLEKIGALKPDIVLLDVMMPGLDGYEVCRRVRAMPELAGTKIIFVSAKAQLKEKLEGYAAGADDYIIKPFEKSCVMAKIRVFTRMVECERALEKKKALLAHLYAKISAPLLKIQVCSQQLKGVKLLDEGQADCLEGVIRATERFSGVLKQIIMVEEKK